MKKFLQEFKQFALRGNAMDMAVGVIIAGGFTGIVSSLTENFINPIIAVLTGQAMYTTQDIMGFAISFCGAVVNFIILAFILFCLIRTMNKAADLRKKPEEPKAPTTKVCPYCKMEVPIEATRCGHCTSMLEE